MEILISMLKGSQKEEAPLHTYYVNHVGPMPPTSKNYTHILLVVDKSTTFTWMYPVKSTNVEDVVKMLERQREVFGNPHRIVADKVGAFKSTEFEIYCDQNNIVRHLISEEASSVNDQVGRLSRMIVTKLAELSVKDPKQWIEFVGRIQMGFNSTVSKTSARTSFESMFRVKMR